MNLPATLALIAVFGGLMILLYRLGQAGSKRYLTHRLLRRAGLGLIMLATFNAACGVFFPAFVPLGVNPASIALAGTLGVPGVLVQMAVQWLL